MPATPHPQPLHADHVHDVLFLNLHSPRCGVTPRSKWPCQDKSHGSGSWESEAKGDTSILARNGRREGGEQAGSPEKEGGGAAVCWHSNKQTQTERRSAAEVMKGPSAEDRTWPMFLSGSKPEASVAPLEVEGLLVVSYFFFLLCHFKSMS